MTFIKRFMDWWHSPFLGDPPITTRKRGHGPTGNFYIEHRRRAGEVSTHLSGHLTRWGAEREVALCKKYLPWNAEGEWVVKSTSEYGRPR